MNKSFISLAEARQKNIKKIYFTWPGLGDNLALSTAAKRYFEINKEKLLIGTTIPELFLNTDHCFVTNEVNFNTIDNIKQKLKDFEIEPIFISASEMKKLDNGKYITLWSKQHFIATYFSRLGIEGKQNIVPYFVLSDKEKKFGKFRKNQIAIMTDGLQNYKTYDFENIQKIVNKLYKKYNFVQIGKETDRKLMHCLDMTGKCSIRETASILYNSLCFVGGIGGLMHLARAVCCPGVIICSLGESINYACYQDNKNIYSHKGCNLCGLNLRDPQHQICLNNYSCIRTVDANDVYLAINRVLSSYNRLPVTEVYNVTLKENIASGLDMYDKHKNIQWCNEAFFKSPVQILKMEILGFLKFKIFITKQKQEYIKEIKLFNVSIFKFLKKTI